MAARVAAIMLAAGRATRFADTKLLAPIGGQPLLRLSLERMLGLFDEIVVVLGHDAARIESALHDMPVRTVLNPRYVEGMGTSVAAGVAALGGDAAAVLIALGDQPVPRTVVEQLLAEWRQHDARIVAPVYAGVRGNPVIFASALFPELRGLTGDRGARDLIATHADVIRTVRFPFPPPIDVDTPADRASLDEMMRNPDDER